MLMKVFDKIMNPIKPYTTHKTLFDTQISTVE